MALDPRIALQSRVLDVGSVFNNALTNIGNIQRIQQSSELQPLRNQLLQTQVGQAEQQALAERNEQKISSVAIGSAEVLPFLQNNDIEGARSTLLRRRQQLIDQGRPTETTDEGLVLLDSDPQLLAQRAQQGVQLGQRLGVFGGQRETPSQKGQARTVRRDGKLISQQEVFNPNTGAIEIVETPIEGELVQRSTGLTGKERIELAGEQATITTRNKLKEQTLAIPEQERVSFLSKNRDNFSADISESKSVLGEIDRAIEIWETAPGTISGPFASRTPALLDDTQELESILAGLGIDRLSNFKGATSERELATAFRAGASIEQDAKAGIRRLKKQRRDIIRNNDRLGGLLNESKALLRKQPEQQAPANQVIRFDAQGNIIQ